MDTRETLINELDAARERLLKLLKDLDPKFEVYPGWTVKELLAHITGWDNLVVETLTCYMNGTEPILLMNQGIDDYNAETLAKCTGWSYEMVWSEFFKTRDHLKQLLHKISPDQFEDELTLPWGSKGRLANFIRIFSQHEIEHEEEILTLTTGKVK